MALFSSRYAPNVKVDASQIREFEKQLELLGGCTVKERRREMQLVVNYGIKDTTRKMKDNAGKIRRRGVLKESIATVSAKATGFGSAVGARSGPKIRGSKKKRAYHAHLVELGTKRQIKRVKPGKKQFRFYSFKNRRWVFTKKIVHGSKAQPYIKPAYDATKGDYPKRIAKKMKTILDGIAAKMRKKRAKQGKPFTGRG